MREHVELSELDLAWMAGVVDALGNVRRRKYGDGGLIILQVCGLQEEQVRKLAQMTGAGATTVERRYSKTICSEHCEEPHQHVNSKTVRWTLTGARAYIVLSAIRPYLRFKRELADEHMAAASRTPWKPATGRKMTDLGWPVPPQPMRSVG